MSLAFRMQGLAADRIQRWGGDGTLRVVTETYDSDTRTTSEVTANYPVRVKAKRRLREARDGTLVRLDRQIFAISAAVLSVEPTIDDRLIVDGSTYTIVDVEKVSPDGATASWWEVEVTT